MGVTTGQRLHAKNSGIGNVEEPSSPILANISQGLRFLEGETRLDVL